MRLRCVARYRSRLLSYDPGDELEVAPEQAAQLLADSPGSFVTVELADETAGLGVETTAPATPPAHRKVEQPEQRKRR